MARKTDYEAALKKIEHEPDDALHAFSLRLPNFVFRKVYNLCLREKVDVATLIRQILSERLDAYLDQDLHVDLSRRRPRPELWACSVYLPDEIRRLAEQTCEGFGLDMPALIQMILAEVLTDWLARARQIQGRAPG